LPEEYRADLDASGCERSWTDVASLRTGGYEVAMGFRVWRDHAITLRRARFGTLVVLPYVGTQSRAECAANGLGHPPVEG
jgi:hypothetical protein